MERTTVHCKYASAKEELLPLLRGRVFHATCWDRVDGILKDGAIRTNHDASLRSAFGSSARSFFRLRQCVSVFDFRTASDDAIATSLLKCSPWQIGHDCNYHIAYFCLRESTYTNLVSWEEWKEAGRPPEMVVPHVEAGHRGDIAVDQVSELLEVIATHVPSAFELALRRGSPARSTDQ